MDKSNDDELICFREGEPYYEYRDTIGKKCGYKNKKGQVVIKPQFEDAHKFSEELARVQLKGKWGYIDRNGDFVIKPRWTRAFNFNNGQAEVSTSEGEIYFIDKTGKIVKQLNPTFLA